MDIKGKERGHSRRVNGGRREARDERRDNEKREARGERREKREVLDIEAEEVAIVQQIYMSALMISAPRSASA
jgi:hypothetical protein